MRLTIENLNVGYRNGQKMSPALCGVDLSLKKGETIGIIGESGAGKSTLALTIMGLLSNTETDGRVLFDDTHITTASEKELRGIRWKRIAMVFQNGLETLNPVMTIGAQIAEPIRRHLGYGKKETDEYVESLLEKTGLAPEWKDVFPHELSGGMRQRVLFAMAVCCRPEILIVDEPFSALDAETRHAMVHLIQDLKAEIGFGMILISHNLPVVQQLTGKVMTLYGGTVVEKGRTSEVLKNPLHPYTRGLIGSVPEFFPYRDLWGIRGEPPAPEEIAGCPFSPRCVQKGDFCAIRRPGLRHTGIERQVACHKNGIETVVKATGISKRFVSGTRATTALEDVDIRLRRGEVVALTGVSGSGKSTLAHILTNVIPTDSGEVIFEGETVKGRSATARRGGMQVVFQDPGEAISSRLSVMEAVREPLDIMKWKTGKERDEKVIKTLETMRLPLTSAFLCRTCAELSGGQRQRIAIARALVTDPAVLIADEMTAMLDPSTEAVILRELRELQNLKGFSMIFITHEIHLARKIAERVYVLNGGRVVEEGAAVDIFDHQHDAHTHQLFQSALNHDKSITVM